MTHRFASLSGIGAGVVGDQTTDEIINEVDWDNMVDSEEDINSAEEEDEGGAWGRRRGGRTGELINACRLRSRFFSTFSRIWCD